MASPAEQALGHTVKLITRQGLMLETQLEIEAPSLPSQWVGMGVIVALRSPKSFPLTPKQGRGAG